MRLLRPATTLLLNAFLHATALALSVHDQLQHFPSLIDADLETLVLGLEKGLFTSVDLVKTYTARIHEVNSTLHVVTELNPDALSIAAETDALRSQGKLLSPLHGIPILIKNNIATADQMTNTAGSMALLGSRVPRDATVAAKLREAGAIILGRVNLSQWANFRSMNSSNGWSAHGGQVYGAYFPGQDPSGSSSGSGVASSLGLALASLGTETSGSILSPADVNSIVGIKPTVGLTSRYLVVPISEHQDTVGPMARSVKDAAYLLQAIAGPDPRDNYTSAIPFEGGLPDYALACDFHALEGKRIGVARNVLDSWADLIDDVVRDSFEEAIEEIAHAGAEIVDVEFTGFDQWLLDKNKSAVFNADFLANVPKYLAELSENPNGLKDVHDVRHFTHAIAEEAAEDRNTLLWDGALDQAWDNTDPRFWEAYQQGLYYGDEGGVLGALEHNDVDAIILPTQISPPIPALVGSPVISVPMGFYPEDWPVQLNVRGDLIAGAPHTPFGISFMGRKWSEAELIGYAYAYEQRTLRQNAVPPFIVPNIEVGDIVGNRLVEGVVWPDDDNVCSREWVERCEMFEHWPQAMRDTGAETKRNWWTGMLEEEEKEAMEDKAAAAAAAAEEVVDET